MPSLFDGIAELGRQGLGLAQSGLQGAGGLLREAATVPFTSPAPDVINNGPVGNLLLRLAEGASAVRNQPGPIQQRIAQQVALAQQRRKTFDDNLGVLAKVGDFLDSVPASERAQRSKELRERFIKDFGGANSGALYDAVHGSPGNALGTIAALKDSPEIQRMINQGASFQEIDAFRKSPEFTKMAQERQDKLVLPELEKKIGSLLKSQAPAVRERLEKISRDGKITLDEVRQLNEVAGQGDQGAELTPAELESLSRVQGEIAQRIPGFVTSEDFQKEKEGLRAFEQFAKEEQIKSQNRIAEKSASGGGAKAPTETSQLSFARDVSKVRRVYRETASQIRRAVDSPLSGVGDIQSLYQFISRQDNTAAREGELDLAQRAASALGKLERITGNITDGRLLDDTQRAQMREVLQQMLTDTESLERDFALQSADVAKNFGIEPSKIVPDLSELGIEKTGTSAVPEDIQTILDKYR